MPSAGSLISVHEVHDLSFFLLATKVELIFLLWVAPELSRGNI